MIAKPTNLVRLELQPFARISGHVLDADRPAIGREWIVTVAPIVDSTESSGVEMRRPVVARTDRAARFRLPPLAPGAYEVRLDRVPAVAPPAFGSLLAAGFPAYRGRFDEFYPEPHHDRVQQIELRAGETRALVIDVGSVARPQDGERPALNGIVRWDGRPLANRKVIARQGDDLRTATTDAVGRYHFADLSEGSWAVELWAKDYTLATSLVDISAEVRENQHTFDIRGGTAGVDVRGPHGEKLPGVSITLNSIEGCRGMTLDLPPDGHLGVGLPAATYRISAKAGRFSSMNDVECVVTAGVVTPVAITLVPTVPLALTLTGAAVEEVTLRHLDSGENALCAVDDAGAVDWPDAWVGTFRVVDLPAGIRAVPDEFSILATEARANVVIRLLK